MPFATESLAKYCYNQVKDLPLPDGDITGRTAIVTGSNVGIGYDAALHLAERGPKRLILAVRNLEAGNTAAQSINKSTNGKITPEVWKLDMASFASVRAFAKRCDAELDRLDVFIANAGILPQSYKATEDGLESSLQVNVVATLLLSNLLIPILQRTAKSPLPGIPQQPHLTINTSFTHNFVGVLKGFENGTMVKEANAMKASDKWDGDCYQRGKAILMLAIPTLVERAGPSVIVTTADPGMVATTVMRDMKGITSVIAGFVAWAFGRTPEQGARPIVWAALSPIKSGDYVADCIVTPPSEMVRSDADGSKSAGIWKEMEEIWGKSA